MGDENTKRTLGKHGAREPFFGVKVAELKKIVKRVKKDHGLSLDLFDTGNSDAMYLAGLIADEKKISKDELRHWADKAYWHMLSVYTVAWVAAESPHGWELGQEWIDSDRENIACTGWSTLANWVLIRPDTALDLQGLKALTERAAGRYQSAPKAVRATIVAFLQTVGVSVTPLEVAAAEAGRQIRQENAEGAADASTDIGSYIEKIRQKGRLGQKKKQARC